MYTQSYCCRPYYPPCAVVYVPMVWVPTCCDDVTVPRDLSADAKTTTATGLVGGSHKAALTLEYLVEKGAASPSVQVTLTAPDGTTSDWSDTAPVEGYHVKDAFLTADAGTKLTLTVNNVTAHLRWCERICC